MANRTRTNRALLLTIGALIILLALLGFVLLTWANSAPVFDAATAIPEATLFAPPGGVP